MQIQDHRMPNLIQVKFSGPEPEKYPRIPVYERE